MSSKGDVSQEKRSSVEKNKKKKKENDDKSNKSRDSSKEKVKKEKKEKKDLKSPKSGKSEDEKQSKTSRKSNKSDKKINEVQEEEQKIGQTQLLQQQQQQQLQMKQQIEAIQQAQERKCVHHEIALQFFCESCEEPICRQCTILGPHNNQLHRINRVEEAYKARVARLSESIRNNLLQKRDQLLGQIHRIEYRIEEIRYVKTIIERDARAEYGGIIERLKSAEGIKVAVLQHEMSELQKDLDRINDIGHTFNEFTRDPLEPIGFLLRSRNLYENIEFLVAKPFKINIDVYPYDLPRELTQMRQELQKVHAQKAYIEYNNEVIWKLVESKRQIEEQIKQQMEEAAVQELNEWSKLADRYQQELKSYHLVCFYCNTQLDEITVNKQCNQNINKQIDPEYRGFTESVPNQKFHGNRNHFFARPSKDYVDYANTQKKIERQIPIREQNSEQNNSFIDIIVEKVRQNSRKQRIDLEKLFSDNDKKQSGNIKKFAFLYIMNQEVGLEEKEAEALFDFFNMYVDSPNKNMFNYKSFLQQFQLNWNEQQDDNPDKD